VDICNVVLHLGDSLWFRFASHLSRKTREANHVAFGSAAATTGRSDILKPPNVCCRVRRMSLKYDARAVGALPRTPQAPDAAAR
jgi:hypothetical protein